MITVGGVAIVTPSDFSVGVMDVSKAERNAAGTILIERITTKRKLEMSWKYLTNAQASALITAVSISVFFTVVYPDPYTGAARSGTFYVGDRNAGMMRYKAGVPEWTGTKFNFIER